MSASAVAASLEPTPPSRRIRVRLVPAQPCAAPSPAMAGPAHRAAPSVRERITVLRATECDTSSIDEPSPPPPAIDPTPLARAVAGACVEVVRGVRPVGQLARWLSLGVLHELRERVVLTSRAPTVAVRPARVRRLMVCELPSGVEVSAAVDDGVRVRAVAFRLEGHRGAWRVTALEIG